MNELKAKYKLLKFNVSKLELIVDYLISTSKDTNLIVYYLDQIESLSKQLSTLNKVIQYQCFLDSVEEHKDVYKKLADS